MVQLMEVEVNDAQFAPQNCAVQVYYTGVYCVMKSWRALLSITVASTIPGKRRTALADES